MMPLRGESRTPRISPRPLSYDKLRFIAPPGFIPWVGHERQTVGKFEATAVGSREIVAKTSHAPSNRATPWGTRLIK